MCGVGVGPVLLCLVLGGGPAAHAQPDSVRAVILEAKGFSPDHSPRGALWRAAVVPGWGQFYNRQYYKMPVVYAGLAGLAYAIYRTNQDYVLHRRAAIFARGQSLRNKGRDIPAPISDWETFKDDYQTVVREAGGDADNLTSLPLRGSQLRSTRDKFRRWRDLSIVGTGLFYVLTVLDAYVSAHLLAFNVGDGLALNVRPTGGVRALFRGDTRKGPHAAPMSPGTNGTGIRLRLSF